MVKRKSACAAQMHRATDIPVGPTPPRVDTRPMPAPAPSSPHRRGSNHARAATPAAAVGPHPWSRSSNGDAARSAPPRWRPPAGHAAGCNAPRSRFQASAQPTLTRRRSARSTPQRPANTQPTA
ncbi:conserved hypothetical protein [Actinomyces sp. oral taxon 180 str. F0310]|nr:conserved hypothetical protein [Actinomyces sp. oral taxon 180 str. F0310]